MDTLSKFGYLTLDVSYSRGETGIIGGNLDIFNININRRLRLLASLRGATRTSQPYLSRPRVFFLGEGRYSSTGAVEVALLLRVVRRVNIVVFTLPRIRPAGSAAEDRLAFRMSAF